MEKFLLGRAHCQLAGNFVESEWAGAAFRGGNVVQRTTLPSIQHVFKLGAFWHLLGGVLACLIKRNLKYAKAV